MVGDVHAESAVRQGNGAVDSDADVVALNLIVAGAVKIDPVQPVSGDDIAGPCPRPTYRVAVRRDDHAIFNVTEESVAAQSCADVIACDQISSGTDSIDAYPAKPVARNDTNVCGGSPERFFSVIMQRG